MGIRVLVCGGRAYSDVERVASVLNVFHQTVGVGVLIEGGATGADAAAAAWAVSNGIRLLVFPVSKEEWRRIGPAAGPIRNRRMLEEGKPDLVVAFPGGRGTANMMKQARAAGVDVHEVVP